MDRSGKHITFEPLHPGENGSSTRQEIRQIVQATLNALDLDYSIFDILHVDDQVDSWKIAFFDRGPANQQRIFQIAVTGGRVGSDEAVKEQVVSQLANHLAGRSPVTFRLR